MRQKPFRILVALGIATVLSGGVMAAPSGNAVLPGSAPAWANSNNYAGPVDPNDSVGFRVYLGWRDGVETLARAVSDPRGAQYGRYLTPQQFRRQFSPSHADVTAVQSWLKSQGFSVDYTPANNHYVAAQGTVAQAQTAFGVQFGAYNVKGRSVRSPAGNVSVPGSLAGIVIGV